jgi:hypothetical protein
VLVIVFFFKPTFSGEQFMQEQIEKLKISEFISFTLSIVCGILKQTFEALGISAEQMGIGLNTVFCLKKDDKKMEFYLNNLLLEIATVDRDEIPLRFDENLRDFDYFADKSARLIDSKLRILFELFSQDDIDKVIDNISQKSSQYERIRIIKFGE